MARSSAVAAKTVRRRSACSRRGVARQTADAAPISVLRISRLALEWQEVKQINSETRRWRENTFISGSYADIDESILQIAATLAGSPRALAAR